MLKNVPNVKFIQLTVYSRLGEIVLPFEMPALRVLNLGNPFGLYSDLAWLKRLILAAPCLKEIEGLNSVGNQIDG